MTKPLILASGSEIRAQLLRNANVPFEVLPVKVDEVSLRASLELDGAKPRDIADHLAESKARKAAGKRQDTLVIGCDQILADGSAILAKPNTKDEALTQLTSLCGKAHHLYSAAVIYEGVQPVWRHVGVVKMHMRRVPPGYLEAYVARNWESIRHSVGGYKLEEEGIRLFHRIEGDYFNVLGLPLLELLAYLTLRGQIDG